MFQQKMTEFATHILRTKDHSLKHLSERQKRSHSYSIQESQRGHIYEDISNTSNEQLGRATEKYPMWEDDSSYNSTPESYQEASFNPSLLFVILSISAGVILISLILYVIYRKCKAENMNYAIFDILFTQDRRRVRNRPVNPILNGESENWNPYRGEATAPPLTLLQSNFDYLDLPPTYADSTQNSRTSSMRSLSHISDSNNQIVNSNQDVHLLPTYEEALVSSLVNTPLGSKTDLSSDTPNDT